MTSPELEYLQNAIVRRDFPALTESNFKRTSDPDPKYNCIAWVAGDLAKSWWPGSEDDHWPEEVVPDDSPDGFATAFAKLGYSVCATGDWEPGIKKLALYAKEDMATHMALQVNETTWSSKLGEAIDVSHTLDALEGPRYGQVVLFLSKSMPIG